MMNSENISISVYRNAVPPQVEAEMEELYQHRYASYIQLQTYGHINETTNTYVVRKDGKAVVALLFRVEHRKVFVLNEQMKIGQAEIERFAQHIFNTFDSVNVISFPVIQTDIQRLSFPYQQSHSTQDIVLTLPASVQEYMSNLGKSTRSYVKRYLNKLKREHPSFRFQIYENEDIRDEHIRAIIALNHARMSTRQQSSYIDEEEAIRMLALLKQRGFVGVLTIDGRVCAGTINFRFGRNYFLQVIAHDPMYDEYGLGTLCCYLTICECIERQGNAYHFLWGQYEYKYRLLGVQCDLDHVAVYRSRFYLLRNADMALKIALAGYNYTARSWLLNKARRKDDTNVASQLAFHLVNGARDIKRWMSRSTRNTENVSPVVRSRPNS